MLEIIRHSRLWEPVSRLYRRSGLKGRVYARAFTPPVRTLSEAAFLQALGAKAMPLREPRPLRVQPPASITAGPMPAEDAALMEHLLTRLDACSVLEIGTNWGFTTAAFLLNTRDDARIWTVDICREMMDPALLAATQELEMCLPRDRTGWIYRQMPEAVRVTQVFQDSLKLDWTEVPDYPEAFDLILVDACHEYDYVKSDTLRVLPRLRPGGILLWHDFYPDVSSWPGVYRFVSEFCHSHRGVVHCAGTHLAAWVKPGDP